MSDMGGEPPTPTRAPGAGGYRRWHHYLVAVVATVATLAWRRADSAAGQSDSGLILLLLPIFLSAYLGGLGPGLVSTVIAALGANYFLLAPRGSFSITAGLDSLPWLSLVVAGVFASVASEALSRHRRKEPRSAGGASTEHKIQTGFAAALALLLLIGTASFLGVARLRSHASRVQHTTEVIASLRLLLGITTDAETSQRGYTITGEETYLEPYWAATRTIDGELDRLRALVAEKPLQEARAETLRRLVKQRLDASAAIIGLRRSQGFEAARRATAMGPGKALQDQVRSLVAEMESTETALLEERERQTRQAVVAAKTIIVGGSGVAFGVVLVALLIVGQDFAGSRRAEAALRRAHDQLETRVEERTAQLAGVNQALRTSEERLAGIITSAMDGIITVDADQRIVLLNPAAERMFGWSEAALKGQPLDRLIPERFRAAHATHLQDFSRTNVTRRTMGGAGAIFGLRASGEEFPIEASISQITVGGQHLFTVILRDITERRRAEEALRTSEERLQTVVNNLAEGLVVSDLEGQLLHWNRAAVEMHGFRTLDECLRRLPEFADIFELSTLDGTILPLEQWPLPRICRGETLRDWEVRLRRLGTDWERVFNYAGGQVHEPGGRPLAFVSMTDITARKQAEQALQQRSEDLARSNADLEQFAYVASHDLQEPLRAVTGSVQLLQRRYQGQLDARADEFITHAVEGTSRMQQLIDDLLAFSRVGTRAGRLQPCDSGRALDAALGNLAVAIRESETLITRDPLPTVAADSSQLTSLLQNLIGNAIKFRSASSPSIHVGAAREGGEWVFSVRDNGIGIEPQYFERIFGVFQRLHTRREYPGTGIGLAICRKIVERHSGRIWVESVPGAGSTFYVTLPDAGGNQEQRHEQTA